MRLAHSPGKLDQVDKLIDLEIDAKHKAAEAESKRKAAEEKIAKRKAEQEEAEKKAAELRQKVEESGLSQEEQTKFERAIALARAEESGQARPD